MFCNRTILSENNIQCKNYEKNHEIDEIFRKSECNREGVVPFFACEGEFAFNILFEKFRLSLLPHCVLRVFYVAYED